MTFGSYGLVLVAWSYLVGLSGAEWATIMAAIVGAGGAGSIITGTVAMKKVRVDEKAAKAQSEVTVRTVAAEEAEAAMRIMGLSVVRLQDEVVDLRARMVQCESRYQEHAAVCPLLRGGGDG